MENICEKTVMQSTNQMISKTGWSKVGLNFSMININENEDY